MGEWIESCVNEIAAPVRNALVGGPFGSDLVKSDYTSTGVPVIRGENLGDNRWVCGEFVFVSPAKAERLSANTAAPGDIVFTQRGAYHYKQIAIVPKGPYQRYLVSQSQMKLTVDRTKADPLFVYYWFRTAEQQEYLQRNAISTGVPHTNLGILRNAPIRLPTVSKQHAIAHILGALDDKIELNRRMNETLEAMARALFKSWFVDFDPVRAKAAGRAPSGMDAETAKLFPSEFVQSEMGEIPRGWRVGTVGEFVELQRGTTYKSSLKGSDGPVLLGLGTIQRNGGFRDDKLVTYGGESPEKLLLGPGDLFVSLKDVTQSADLLGAVARVPSHVKRGRLTQDTVKLEFRRDRDIADVLYRTLLTQEYRDYCRQHSTGTTNLGLSREDFLSYPIMVAPRNLLTTFNGLIRALESRVEVLVSENITLAALRDTLLPRLLSGELSVAQAEAFAEGNG